MLYRPVGRSGPEVPPIIFGTSSLGNLYQALSYAQKRDIVAKMFEHLDGAVVLDSAGKYGAGLALEIIGRVLHELNPEPGRIKISNKLGWLRVPLRTSEPTFETGVWMDLEHDAEQRISYSGILECWEQGKELLGAPYFPQLVSVHDPDEYLAAAKDAGERQERLEQILGAYRALEELKKSGQVAALGLGAKDWRVIREICSHVQLDWIMLALSFTVLCHPPELLQFLDELAVKGIGIINSAVFHAGFLTGGRYFDYRIADPVADRALFEWREKFVALCAEHAVPPAAACVQFGFSHPGVVSVALNTSKPERIEQNIALVNADVPEALWSDMKEGGLISPDYAYLG